MQQLAETFEHINYPQLPPADGSTGFIALSDPSPSAPPPPNEEEKEGFTFVQQPTPLLSLASNDSIHQLPASSHEEEEEEEEEMRSIVSQKSDDSEFVVVVPACFKLDLPLEGFDPPQSVEQKEKEEDKEKEGEREDTPTCNGGDGYVTPPSEIDTSLVTVTMLEPEAVSPNTARRRDFVPDRMTLQRVWCRRSHDPIQYATGLVNTMSDLVNKHVRVAPPTKQSSDEESTPDEVITFLHFILIGGVIGIFFALLSCRKKPLNSLNPSLNRHSPVPDLLAVPVPVITLPISLDWCIAKTLHLL